MNKVRLTNYVYSVKHKLKVLQYNYVTLQYDNVQCYYTISLCTTLTRGRRFKSVTELSPVKRGLCKSNGELLPSLKD